MDMKPVQGCQDWSDVLSFLIPKFPTESCLTFFPADSHWPDIKSNCILVEG